MWKHRNFFNNELVSVFALEALRESGELYGSFRRRLFGFSTGNGGELRSDVIERLSPECGHNKDIQSNDFQISLTLSGEKILSISSGTRIHVLFLWQYSSLRIFLFAAIWILKVATAIVVKETSSFPVIKKDVKKVIWLLWIKKKLYCEAF